MKLSDFKGIFKKESLTVLTIDNPNEDYFVVKMSPKEGVFWYPGEHGIFTLPKRKFTGRKFRAFSVASIPEEGVVTIGTRTGKDASGFKKELLSMKKGDTVNLRGPFGWFKIKDNKSPIVFITGGVGVTPVRAILKQLELKNERDIEIVFASNDYYLFGDEIEEICSTNDLINLHKTKSRDDTKLVLEQLISKYASSSYYFISGSRPFIKGIKKQIKSSGIKSKKIINDPFFGY